MRNGNILDGKMHFASKVFCVEFVCSGICEQLASQQWYEHDAELGLCESLFVFTQQKPVKNGMPRSHESSPR